MKSPDFPALTPETGASFNDSPCTYTCPRTYAVAKRSSRWMEQEGLGRSLTKCSSLRVREGHTQFRPWKLIPVCIDQTLFH